METEIYLTLLALFLYPDHEEVLDFYKKYKVGFKNLDIEINFNLCNREKYDYDYCEHNEYETDEELRKLILVFAKICLNKKEYKNFTYTLLRRNTSKHNFKYYKKLIINNRHASKKI